MNIKGLTCSSAVVIALGTAVFGAGAGVAAAQPGPPCGFGNCQGPGGPGGPDRPGGPGGPGGPEHPGGQGGPGGPGWQGDHGGPGGPGDRGPGGPGGPGGPDDRGGHWGPPPPDLSWRGMDQGRFDHQPFNYNGRWVTPLFNPDFNGWGFWFFGIWIPL
ncbi:hypothetical protein [Mycolicibacterium setense]|uniref:hypothetical protein n=1 Tax=Mycolicibacterium setense TaxID=431269 RepID=UPI0009EE1A5F|nr:hypothetical protein [Mycolicibacterium setense]